jgi:N6-adenosine-specific RNA methylase IME4
MSARQPDNLPFPPAPGERFGVVAVDPPWHYYSRGKVDEKSDRSPQKHYPTASIEHLCTLPMQDFLLPNAWVPLWITGPLLATGVQLVLADAWGLEISGMGFDWLKLWPNTDMGIFSNRPLLEQDVAQGGGYTTRKNLEYVVLMKRGNPRVLRRDIRSVIISPRREHSRKPEEFYRRLEYFAEGPFLSMFSGAPRPGWIDWGFTHRESDAAPTGIAV